MMEEEGFVLSLVGLPVYSLGDSVVSQCCLMQLVEMENFHLMMQKDFLRKAESG